MALYASLFKRPIELVLVTVTAPVWVPLAGAVALAVWVRLGRPLLFWQTRSGRDGRPFRLVKFRTMRKQSDKDGRLLPDSERLTPFGRRLRATSLDELPTLLNVLRGEMSLVGPRPLLMAYLERYTLEQARRHDVHPGITGWAQVNGRNAVSWEKKFEMDVWYVDHVSFFLDAFIIAKTVLRVFRREGIAAEGHVTAPEFMGTTPRQEKP